MLPQLSARLKLPKLQLVYHSDFERQFCDLRLEQHSLMVTRTLAVVAVGYHATSLLWNNFMVSEADRTLFFSTHCVFLALHAFWWLVLRRLHVNIQKFLWLLQVA